VAKTYELFRGACVLCPADLNGVGKMTNGEMIRDIAARLAISPRTMEQVKDGIRRAKRPDRRAFARLMFGTAAYRQKRGNSAGAMLCGMGIEPCARL
jgi:hypothetical protein